MSGAERLSELVDYQKGSVVSRVLLKAPAGNVTLFAFDRGEGLSEHAVAREAMIQLLEGTAEVTISGSRQTLSAGEMILLPANEPHAVDAPERFKMLLTIIGG